MFFVNLFSNIIDAGTQQLIQWVSQLLPQIFLFLILLNAITRLVGRARVEWLAVRCGANPLLRYMVLPFLSAIVLGNPMAISMGRYLPEEYKPAYFASASYHCHTNSGIFHHINPAELFLWLGIANGVLARGLDLFPLAIRYLCAGLAANFISGYATEIITRKLEKKEHIHLAETLDFLRSKDGDREGADGLSDPISSEGTGGNHADCSSDPISSEGTGGNRADCSSDPISSEGTGGNRADCSSDPISSESTGGNRADCSSDPISQNPGGNISGSNFSAASGEAVFNNSPRIPVSPEDPADPPYHSITITRGNGGYGGPVTVTPTENRHIVLYMTAGGLEPEPLEKIISLTGMTAINGNRETCPDEKVALAIIDCGGTLRCGIYPGKGIPTLNLLATGKSGPLAKYMTEDLYVSAVTSHEISPALQKNTPENILQNKANSTNAANTIETDFVLAKEIPAANTPAESTHTIPSANKSAAGPSESKAQAQNITSANVSSLKAQAQKPSAANISAAGPSSSKTLAQNISSEETVNSSRTDTRNRSHSLHIMRRILEPASFISKVVSVFHQSARDAVKTCLEMLLPFMGFAALFIGICRGSGLTEFLAELIKPMGGSLPGLFLIGIFCSIPGLSAILGAGAVAAQIFSTVTGDLIISGGIAPALALPALFAINCQCACDFIPVGLSMMESKPETMQLGITAVTLSRFVTGWIRILIALIFTIGLYK